MEAEVAEVYRSVVRGTIPEAGLCPAVQSQENSSPSLDPEMLP